jgi:hypothetical protein
MQDVALGQERVRVWPRKRGRAKTKAQREANDKFRVAQMCCNYVAPQIYLWAHEALQPPAHIRPRGWEDTNTNDRHH